MRIGENIIEKTTDFLVGRDFLGNPRAVLSNVEGGLYVYGSDMGEIIGSIDFSSPVQAGAVIQTHIDLDYNFYNKFAIEGKDLYIDIYRIFIQKQGDLNLEIIKEIDVVNNNLNLVPIFFGEWTEEFGVPKNSTIDLELYYTSRIKISKNLFGWNEGIPIFFVNCSLPAGGKSPGGEVKVKIRVWGKVAQYE